MKHLVKWSAGALLVLVVTGVAVLASRRGTPVQLMPVVRTGIVQSVVATGRLNAPARMNIGAEVTATVREVRVREGDQVKAGEVLLRLSDAEARAALQQARAALMEARGRATQQATVAAPVASQAVVQAEAAFTSAEREHQRAHELVAQDFFPQQKLDDARIDANVDEKNLRLIQPGMPARAVADAYPGQSFDAQLNYIAPAVDPQRGTVEVRLAVPNPPPFLRPDMTVSVELLGGMKKDALVLPSGAVRDADREAPWVLALQDGRAVRAPVKLGLRGVGSVEITEGLREGAPVIPQTEKAVPGDRVRPGPSIVPEKGMEVPSFISR